MAEILQVLLRTTAAFFAVLILTRILNKEQVSQLTFYDYITGITIGSMAGTMAIDTEVKLLPDLMGIILWAVLTFLMGYLSLMSRPARKLLEGEPTVLIHNGCILERNMGKLRYNLDDLLSQLRGKSVFNIADVEFAILEPNGQLSVLTKSQKRPVTPEDFRLPTEYEGVPTELIEDGKIITANLQQVHLNQEWLTRELRKRGIYDVAEVVYASLDSAGRLYIDKRKDQLTNIIDASDYPSNGGLNG